MLNKKLILVCVLGLYNLPSSCPAQAAIAFVQAASGDAGAATSQTTTFDKPVRNGDLVIAFARWDDQRVTITRVADQFGNKYMAISGPTNMGTMFRSEAFYAKRAQAFGPDFSVTATFSGRTTSSTLLDIIEYSGIDTSDPLDLAGSTAGKGTVQHTPSLGVTHCSNEVIVGLFAFADYAAPFLVQQGLNNRGGDAASEIEDTIAGSATRAEVALFSNRDTSWTATLLTFRGSNPSCR